MVWSWWKRRRRREVLAQPFPDEWLHIVRRNFHHYEWLTEPERAKLRDDLRILVVEKNWEGCGGLELTDEVRVTVAAHASLLLLGFQEHYFPLVQSILVYPTAFAAPEQTPLGPGLVLEGHAPREGEAWYRGPVIISWDDTLSAGRGESGGHNLVLHEFAHQLDMENGSHADGIPPLESRELAARWAQVMEREYRKLCENCARRREPVLDCYGTTNMAEFFAVATEHFFEEPTLLAHHHPQLYRLLRDYYRQDPAKRVSQDLA